MVISKKKRKTRSLFKIGKTGQPDGTAAQGFKNGTVPDKLGRMVSLRNKNVLEVSK